MDLLQALRTRKSIRAFKPEPVPRSLITQVLEAARWSPSWGNTQPWELVVVGGDVVRRLTADLVAAFAGKVPRNPDVPMPAAFPDDYQHRYMACAAGLFGTMGIAREDKASRRDHMLNMTRAYGAPAIIYMIFNSALEVPYTMFDLGSLTHAVCLAAEAHGLGTCIEAQGPFIRTWCDATSTSLKPTRSWWASPWAIPTPNPRPMPSAPIGSPWRNLSGGWIIERIQDLNRRGAGSKQGLMTGYQGPWGGKTQGPNSCRGFGPAPACLHPGSGWRAWAPSSSAKNPPPIRLDIAA